MEVTNRLTPYGKAQMTTPFSLRMKKTLSQLHEIIISNYFLDVDEIDKGVQSKFQKHELIYRCL